MPNRVSVLIEYPSIDIMPKVPSSTTGTAMVGMIVARQFCRNRNMTRNTSTTASTSVWITCSTERRTNGVVRSEEHTSELQSLMRTSYAVSCLKKKNKKTTR